MNECPELGSAKRALSVHDWVSAEETVGMKNVSKT
jgi:hypothetical protein